MPKFLIFFPLPLSSFFLCPAWLDKEEAQKFLEKEGRKQRGRRGLI